MLLEIIFKIYINIYDIYYIPYKINILINLY